MLAFEQEIVATTHGEASLLADLERQVAESLPDGSVPLRFAVTETNGREFRCELGLLGRGRERRPLVAPLFDFRRRVGLTSREFNVVVIVPTGIGAEIGGHAGDAAPVVRLLGQFADRVITHPNVVNASDINELPGNGLYVEGSVLCRLLMGTVGLLESRQNRVLVVIDSHKDSMFVSAAVNSVNAGRTSYGLQCPEVVLMESPVRLRARYATSGRAAGRAENMEPLVQVLSERQDQFDAVAISSVIDVPHEFHREYFERAGDMVNPWGGVEALLTHAVSTMFDVPSAHAPMFESQEIANMDVGVVDPRMAAEAVSVSFIQCALKGLHRAPRIVTDPSAMVQSGVLTASDVSCLVIPDGCLGLPTLAALEQGIPVVAVRENRNIMRNNLSALPWARGQFFVVENYWEAAGVLAAIKAGIAPESVRRPSEPVPVSTIPIQQQQGVTVANQAPRRGPSG